MQVKICEEGRDQEGELFYRLVGTNGREKERETEREREI